jgi:hypothetical protein
MLGTHRYTVKLLPFALGTMKNYVCSETPWFLFSVWVHVEVEVFDIPYIHLGVRVKKTSWGKVSL